MGRERQPAYLPNAYIVRKETERKEMTGKAQTSAEEQLAFAENLVDDIEATGDVEGLNASILLDSMAILGYVLVEAKDENYASLAFMKTLA